MRIRTGLNIIAPDLPMKMVAADRDVVWPRGARVVIWIGLGMASWVLLWSIVRLLSRVLG